MFISLFIPAAALKLVFLGLCSCHIIWFLTAFGYFLPIPVGNLLNFLSACSYLTGVRNVIFRLLLIRWLIPLDSSSRNQVGLCFYFLSRRDIFRTALRSRHIRLLRSLSDESPLSVKALWGHGLLLFWLLHHTASIPWTIFWKHLRYWVIIVRPLWGSLLLPTDFSLRFLFSGCLRAGSSPTSSLGFNLRQLFALHF